MFASSVFPNSEFARTPPSLCRPESQHQQQGNDSEYHKEQGALQSVFLCNYRMSNQSCEGLE